MNPKELQKLKESLLKEKEVLETELGRIATKNPDIEGDYQAHFHKPDQSDTLDEKAHSITDYEEERAVEQSLELRLKDINETLKKLEGDKYGDCETCMAPIDKKRLEVIPVAKFCVDCAKKARLV
ncbi:MAG: TraR/DksA C4-type zinc finger protein [Candidatus Paceibacterota bacterium]